KPTPSRPSEAAPRAGSTPLSGDATRSARGRTRPPDAARESLRIVTAGGWRQSGRGRSPRATAKPTPSRPSEAAPRAGSTPLSGDATRSARGRTRPPDAARESLRIVTAGGWRQSGRGRSPRATAKPTPSRPSEAAPRAGSTPLSGDATRSARGRTRPPDAARESLRIVTAGGWRQSGRGRSPRATAKPTPSRPSEAAPRAGSTPLSGDATRSARGRTRPPDAARESLRIVTAGGWRQSGRGRSPRATAKPTPSRPSEAAP